MIPAGGVTAYESHPLALRVPGMTDLEYDALRDDIAANGLMTAITLYEGRVLDGRHRLRACRDTGITPRFEEYDGDSPATFVVSLNAKRRNLTTGQLAMLATEFLPDLESEARTRQAVHLKHGEETPSVQICSNGTEGRSADTAAEVVGVSPRSVYQAKRILREDPDLAERVRSGEVAIDTAHKAVAEKAPGRNPRDQNGGSARPAAVSRIAEQAEAIAMAIGALNLTKSCERMIEDERQSALASCKAGLRALNTMARALAAREKEHHHG